VLFKFRSLDCNPAAPSFPFCVPLSLNVGRLEEIVTNLGCGSGKRAFTLIVYIIHVVTLNVGQMALMVNWS